MTLFIGKYTSNLTLSLLADVQEKKNEVNSQKVSQVYCVITENIVEQ